MTYGRNSHEPLRLLILAIQPTYGNSECAGAFLHEKAKEFTRVLCFVTGEVEGAAEELVDEAVSSV